MTAQRVWPLAAVALFLLLGWTASLALGRLAQARAEHRALTALTTMPIAEPAALIPPTQALHSAAMLGERVTRLALQFRILAEQVAPLEAGPRQVAADIAVSGGEPAVLGFVHALEAGPPAVRLSRWRIEALPGGAVRLRGRAVAGW